MDQGDLKLPVPVATTEANNNTKLESNIGGRSKRKSGNIETTRPQSATAIFNYGLDSKCQICDSDDALSKTGITQNNIATAKQDNISNNVINGTNQDKCELNTIESGCDLTANVEETELQVDGNNTESPDDQYDSDDDIYNGNSKEINSSKCSPSRHRTDLNFNGFVTKLPNNKKDLFVFLKKNKTPPALTDSYTSSRSKSTADIPTLDLTQTLPPLDTTITTGFGIKMVATSNCQQIIYRSVPPRPLHYAFTEVLDSKLHSRLRSKTAPVSTNSPEEFIQRFKSRPTTRPKVVEFDGSTVSSKTKKSAIGAAFPTARAKVYIGHSKSPHSLSSEVGQ